MSDRLNITTKKRQNSDSTFAVNPFQSGGFRMQQKAAESDPATKAQLWENYQQAKQLNQNGANIVSVPIQAKLTIGQTGDKYEQEADRVADRVMAMSEPAQVRREELLEEEQLQMKPLAETISPLVQREGLPEEEKLQIKQSPVSNTPAVTPDLKDRQIGGINTKPIHDRMTIQRDSTNPTAPSGQKQQGESNPLSEKARSFMEQLNKNDLGSDWDETKVENTINSFPDPELKRQIGKNKTDQAEFLAGMLQYNNNSLQQTIDHFTNIRKTNVPGEVHLHSAAAERLEMVAGEIEKLGQPMPATTVALGLRGRYSPHNKMGRGLMAHPMGYAIDYRATTNPMITDRRLVTLIQLLTGEEQTNFQVEPSYSKRRSLIKKMGKEHALDEQASSPEETAFFEKFDREFERLSTASEKFKTDLPPGLVELKSLKQRSQKLEKDLKNLKKNHKPKNKTQENSDAIDNEINNVTNELEQVNGKINDIQSDLPTLFKPWTDKINLQKQEIVNVISEKEIFVKVDGDWQNIAGSSLLAKTDRELNNIKNQLDTQLKSIKADRKSIDSKLKSKKISESDRQNLMDSQKEGVEQENRVNTGLATLKEILPKKTKYDRLVNLENALNNDKKFSLIGENTVKNPSVFQLIDRGFFTPDKDVEPGQKIDPNKHGFNLLFMKNMLKHGFDQGINWDPTNSDAMHFELVEGVENIS
jgi:hypothetical protein